VLSHCLEKRPNDRFQSARDLAFDLRTILSGAGIGPSARQRAKPHGHPAVWLAVVATTLLLGVSTWLYLGGGNVQAIDSLAVLPLINASLDADAEYLS